MSSRTASLRRFPSEMASAKRSRVPGSSRKSALIAVTSATPKRSKPRSRAKAFRSRVFAAFAALSMTEAHSIGPRLSLSNSEDP